MIAKCDESCVKIYIFCLPMIVYVFIDCCNKLIATLSKNKVLIGQLQPICVNITHRLVMKTKLSKSS
jgi:hypothetical protein